MGSGFDPMQLASQGAQVLVAEMVKSGWSSLRERLAKIFRWSGDATRQLDMIDADRRELIQASEAEKEAVRGRLLGRWMVQLGALLDQYPEAGKELLALIDASASSASEGATRHSLTAFGNTSSQIVQAGENIQTGGGDFTFTPPPT
jgi:hypothetical protein